ncbi:TldD protein, part of TldE/TldD proteolytic complex [Candidatus Syntrophocurvum alkaliphilum]|uniref:TldD protein, part of TldE/TldD proteolytic complex n=1 Tax=Candidatus Syntrophocurvum alkaliphilum TaxID=2293317 RepID=A0A6I6D706_9FIRM|nr:TldD/PmbA family protein [Candidatus Syntrophocurvum alkaliphilum]QGT98943.1 TldD protein, part of TldE/TldD proteolytic complex [Candidatus Syntrophocurvum alkaliphilum]
MILDKIVLSKVLTEAMSKGGDFAEIYIEEKKVNSIFCEDDKIEKINNGREKGAGIRVIKDGHTAYAYTNDLSEEGLLKTATVAAKATEFKEKVDTAINLETRQPSFEIDYKVMPESVDFKDKIDLVLRANNKARSLGEEVKQVTVSVGDVHKKKQIANSNGVLVEDELARVRFMINVVAARDGIIQTGYESVAGVRGWEIFGEFSVEDLAEKAGLRAIKMLSAKQAPAGRMPVVMSAEAGGTMVHEACGHGLELDLVQKGLSVYKGKLGQKVAAECVTVIDDGTMLGEYGTLRFDDEGNPTQKNVLIENGVLKNYMNDYITAEKEGVSFTGNGRRESYQHKPIPRMTNTYIASGKDDPEEIIKSTAKGLLVKKMGGGQVNTTNGDFVFDVQEGYIIENGEIKYPVRGATLSGNGPKALADIDKVGNDLGFAIGVCGKDGQGVPVSDAQPTIRIKEMTVGGTAMGDE